MQKKVQPRKQLNESSSFDFDDTESMNITEPDDEEIDFSERERMLDTAAGVFYENGIDDIENDGDCLSWWYDSDGDGFDDGGHPLSFGGTVETDYGVDDIIKTIRNEYHIPIYSSDEEWGVTIYRIEGHIEVAPGGLKWVPEKI